MEKLGNLSINEVKLNNYIINGKTSQMEENKCAMKNKIENFVIFLNKVYSQQIYSNIAFYPIKYLY